MSGDQIPDEVFEVAGITDPDRRARIREQVDLLPPAPTAPGLYRDFAGNYWLLTREGPEEAASGRWFDQTGATRPRSWHPVIRLLHLTPVL